MEDLDQLVAMAQSKVGALALLGLLLPVVVGMVKKAAKRRLDADAAPFVSLLIAVPAVLLINATVPGAPELYTVPAVLVGVGIGLAGVGVRSVWKAYGRLAA